MKNIYALLFILWTSMTAFSAAAQNFKSKQKSQERTIKAAYKNGKVTEREYYKLMNEQEIIKSAIKKYEADDIWTPHEKNVIHDKLVRAEKRLRRYKTNSEVY